MLKAPSRAYMRVEQIAATIDSNIYGAAVTGTMVSFIHDNFIRPEIAHTSRFVRAILAQAPSRAYMFLERLEKLEKIAANVFSVIV